MRHAPVHKGLLKNIEHGKPFENLRTLHPHLPVARPHEERLSHESCFEWTGVNTPSSLSVHPVIPAARMYADRVLMKHPVDPQP